MDSWGGVRDGVVVSAIGNGSGRRAWPDAGSGPARCLSGASAHRCRRCSFAGVSVAIDALMLVGGVGLGARTGCRGRHRLVEGGDDDGWRGVGMRSRLPAVEAEITPSQGWGCSGIVRTGARRRAWGRAGVVS